MNDDLRRYFDELAAIPAPRLEEATRPEDRMRVLEHNVKTLAEYEQRRNLVRIPAIDGTSGATESLRQMFGAGMSGPTGDLLDPGEESDESELIPDESDLNDIEDVLLNCCSEEFTGVIDGPASGDDATDTDADVDYPLPDQDDWDALRASVFGSLADTNGTPSLLVTGGLGRYGNYTSEMIDVDTISITCNAALANNLEFHFDTSSVADKPIRRAVMRIYTTPPGTGTGPGPDDYGETFEFSLCEGDGTVIQDGFDANTPDRVTSGGLYAFEVEIDPTLIVTDGDTEFKFTYDDTVTTDPDVWPFNEDDTEEYVNAWMTEPVCKLYLVYDAYIPDP